VLVGLATHGPAWSLPPIIGSPMLFFIENLLSKLVKGRPLISLAFDYQ